MPTNQLAPPVIPGLFMPNIGPPNQMAPDPQVPGAANMPLQVNPMAPLSPADVYNYNAANLGDAWQAAQDPATWREAAQNYGQGMLMGSIGPGGKVAPAEAMWDAFDAAHAASGLDKFSRMNLFQHGPSDLEISHVQVDPAMRGQGVGNQLMDMLTNKADEHGVTLHASPASDADPETGLDYDGLREWYQRWGFDPSGSGDRLTRSPAATTQEQPTPGFTAYHGSPHAFDQFDLSKIGTGEGAQAYGHGMYLADSEGVARSYRDQLAGDGFLTADGSVFDPSSLQHMNVRSTLNRTGDIDAALTRAKGLLPGTDQTSPMLQNDISTLEALKAAGGIKPNPGHMYEVNVNADPAKFLDWDAPLSQQHPDVQAALAKLPDDVRGQFAASGQQSKEGWGDLGEGNPNDYVTGAKVYRLLGDDPAVAAQALQQVGIPGIRYLDQGSRGAGEGTRNSVVFDPATMNIIRRYGLAGLMAGGAAAATQQPSQ